MIKNIFIKKKKNANQKKSFLDSFFQKKPKKQFFFRQVINCVNNKKSRMKGKFCLPGIDIFSYKENLNDVGQKAIEDHSEKLEEKLKHFGVNGRISNIQPGPLITMYEYQPDIDSKISKITALEDDLAMALSAMSIRIIAPIPGKNAVGFEIANPSRQGVLFSNTVLHNYFQNSNYELPISLGVNVIGEPVVVDLATMPHLLIGGTTGSGKSVGLNSIIASLLCKQSPDDLKMILIDPKRLEFSQYNDIPHLLFPIISNPNRATAVLQWVTQEMERRYEKMANVGVKNILEHKKAVSEGRVDSDGQMLETIPYLTVFIDELADLMIVSGKQVESHIVRIAQMARASGIHMVVATQRPSVDIVTGLIKVNFPSRIAFRVSSKVDSRTILDQQGAEKLLGKGDMLFMHASQPHLTRVHGSYISDNEIQNLTNHLRKQRLPDYLDLHEILNTQKQKDLLREEDTIYPEVLKYLGSVKEISISLLQRKFNIGFNRSAKIIEKLEDDGRVGPIRGSKPRKVL